MYVPENVKNHKWAQKPVYSDGGRVEEFVWKCWTKTDDFGEWLVSAVCVQIFPFS